MFLQEVSEVTTIPQALVNTGLGMGTVFLVLILISFIIYLFKFIPLLFAPKKDKAAQTAAAEPAKAPEPAQEKPAAAPDDAQLVAVIAAAVAAQMEEETGVPVAADGLVIRSIKKRTFSL